MGGTDVTVRVLAFARIAELLGRRETVETLTDGSSLRDLWNALVEQRPELAPLGEATRFAKNGRLAGASDVLSQGDEVALLPPVGGG